MLTAIKLEQWYGNVQPAKLLAKLNISPPESVFTGWDDAGLNDVVAA